jgi:signal transduction histidine kinase
VARIVVVDDEQSIRELFGFWLEEGGHSVRVAESAAEAQQHLSREPCDVLVTDISMAHTSGIDLLTWSRQQDADMPVVLVTGKPGVDTAVEALRLGAYDYLLKPVNGHDLARVVDRAATHRRLLFERQQLEERNRRYRALLEERVAERTTALSRRNSQLVLLQEVADTINALDDIDTLYQRLVDTVHKTFGYADVSFFVVDWDARLVRLQAVAGEFRHVWRDDYAQPLGEGLVGVALDGQTHVLANDVSEYKEYRRVDGRDVISEAIFPVRVDDEVAALLVVAERTASAFDDTDVLVMRTLTEHLSVAIANARLYVQLHNALDARDRMLANVSHELRSPLSVICAWAEMLHDETLGPLADDAHHAASNILNSAEHLTHLVNLLLTFQRLDREELEMTALRVRPWLEASCNAWKPVFERTGVTLLVEVESGVGVVRANHDYLQQVLNNLMDNVRKFSAPGGVARIRAWRERDEVLVSVSDNGIGVPPDKLPLLFQRFYQVDAGTTRRYGGMGLGLSVSQDIVERHGGRIWAESQGEGQGLTMVFALPAPDEPRIAG